MGWLLCGSHKSATLRHLLVPRPWPWDFSTRKKTLAGAYRGKGGRGRGPRKIFYFIIFFFSFSYCAQFCTSTSIVGSPVKLLGAGPDTFDVESSRRGRLMLWISSSEPPLATNPLFGQGASSKGRGETREKRGKIPERRFQRERFIF